LLPNTERAHLVQRSPDPDVRMYRRCAFPFAGYTSVVHILIIIVVFLYPYFGCLVREARSSDGPIVGHGDAKTTRPRVTLVRLPLAENVEPLWLQGTFD
jgi:hypothetical protein